jgi:hypothetical protein
MTESLPVCPICEIQHRQQAASGDQGTSMQDGVRYRIRRAAEGSSLDVGTILARATSTSPIRPSLA